MLSYNDERVNMIYMLKKHSIKINKRIFYKYLISYSILFLLPLLVMSFLIFNYFVWIFKAETEKSYSDTISQIMENIDTNILEINRISLGLESDKKIPAYMTPDSSEGWMEIIDTLKMYTFMNDNISEVLFFLKGSSMIFSSSSTYNNQTLPNVMNKAYQIDEKNYAVLQDLLSAAGTSESSKVYSLSRNNGSLILFIRQIRGGTLVFIIKEEKLRSYINNVFRGYNSNTIVINQEGNIKISQKKSEYLD